MGVYCSLERIKTRKGGLGGNKSITHLKVKTLIINKKIKMTKLTSQKDIQNEIKAHTKELKNIVKDLFIQELYEIEHNEIDEEAKGIMNENIEWTKKIIKGLKSILEE